QAEDGIRDKLVTGVQTCALPILWTTNRPTILPRWPALLATPELFMFATNETWVWFPTSTRDWDWRGVNLFGQFPPTTISATPMQIGRASCRERVKSTGGGWAVGE